VQRQRAADDFLGGVRVREASDVLTHARHPRGVASMATKSCSKWWQSHTGMDVEGGDDDGLGESRRWLAFIHDRISAGRKCVQMARSGR